MLVLTYLNTSVFHFMELSESKSQIKKKKRVTFNSRMTLLLAGNVFTIVELYPYLCYKSVRMLVCFLFM